MGLQFRSWLYVLTFVLLAPSPIATAGGSTTTIVTSNNPLALIAQQLLGAHGSAVSLLKPGQTPHDFALSFSDRRRIAEADLIVWIGADI
ncbi:MAG: zinc ABC transporter substrate-binding protein, partial [Pseudomonadota bacterium]|nr:zinc ABC transporter substrate-binding protein [Pseudomonadota bacterium]